MYPRSEKFRVLNHDDDENYELEHGVRRASSSRYSGGFVALLLLVWINVATLFGGLVVLLTSQSARQALLCKFGDRSWLYGSEADNGCSFVPTHWYPGALGWRFEPTDIKSFN